MNESKAPAPIFRLTLPPLVPRLSDFNVITDAKLVDERVADAGDPRLLNQPSTAMQVIAQSAKVLLIEWPDGTLARACLLPGRPLSDSMAEALREAYQAGREALEQVYREAGDAAGDA